MFFVCTLICIDQILLYAVFDLSQQSCKTRDYCEHYFISRKMYQINETKMVPEILSLWAGGSNVKLYIGSKWGCWLNQHFLKVQATKMVQPLGYVGSNGGVGWTSIWRWLSQHFLKVQPTKMVQPSGNVGSKCWCWFNQHLKIVEPAYSEGSTNTSILNQQNLMVEPSKNDGWTG